MLNQIYRTNRIQLLNTPWKCCRVHRKQLYLCSWELQLLIIVICGIHGLLYLQYFFVLFLGFLVSFFFLNFIFLLCTHSFQFFSGIIILTYMANKFRLHKLSNVDQFVMSYGGELFYLYLSLVFLIKKQKWMEIVFQCWCGRDFFHYYLCGLICGNRAGCKCGMVFIF